jgi:SPP1 gp7 family putative phage head morphogenesis protein
LRNITNRNNQQTAYSAGRYAKMQDVKKARPYWQFVTVGDDRVRPSHAILDGRVFEADHEFWAENYPPNGHKCRCGVRTLSARQVEQEGLEVETEMPGDGMYTDPKTGMEYHVARPGADKGWRDNPGRAWVESGGTVGLPLGRYPDLAAQDLPLYLQKILRPAPVKDFAELEAGLRDRVGAHLKNSDGFTTIERTREKSLMWTDGEGSLQISDSAKNSAKYNAYQELKSAWNKLASGGALSWNEEYSIEALWHEITHNRQKWGDCGDKYTTKRGVMETVTQWTARRTYPAFLRSLGGSPLHLESIKAGGLGYGLHIKKFDSLLAALGIDESVLLPEMQRIMDTVKNDVYLDDVANFLSQQSGKKRAAVKQAIAKVTEEKKSQKDYEWDLRVLGLTDQLEGRGPSK